MLSDSKLQHNINLLKRSLNGEIMAEEKFISSGGKYAKACEAAYNEARAVVQGGNNWGKHGNFVNDRSVAISGHEVEYTHYSSARRDVSRQRKKNWVMGIEQDPFVSSFESRIALLYKFNLGNCHQFAYAALYFCLKNKIPAEIFRVTNGNHAFLVIGRRPGSDPGDPSTWGDDAMICDPWDKQWYNVKERGVFSIQARYPNYKIAPRANENTDYLQQRRDIKWLKTFFLWRLKKEVTRGRDFLQQLKTSVTSVENFSDGDRKSLQVTIAAVETRLAVAMQQGKQIFTQCYKATVEEMKHRSASAPWLDSYSITRQHAQRQLDSLSQEVASCFALRDRLSKPRPNGWTDTLFSFFHRPCATPKLPMARHPVAAPGDVKHKLLEYQPRF